LILKIQDFRGVAEIRDFQYELCAVRGRQQKVLITLARYSGNRAHDAVLPLRGAKRLRRRKVRDAVERNRQIWRSGAAD
jgi:hypothetical protein